MGPENPGEKEKIEIDPLELTPDVKTSDPESGGMKVGNETNTTDQQIKLEVEQHNLGIATVSEQQEEQKIEGNPYGDQKANEARVEAYNAVNSGSNQNISGTIDSAAREKEELLLEKEKKERDELIALLVDHKIDEDLANLVADFAEREGQLASLGTGLAETVQRANDLIEELLWKDSQLDIRHDELQKRLEENQARLDEINEQLKTETDPDKIRELQYLKEGLEADNIGLGAEIDQNRDIKEIYRHSIKGTASQIRDAQKAMEKAVAGKGNLQAQLKEAMETGADPEKIQKIKDQMKALDEQIAESREQIETLSRNLEGVDKQIKAMSNSKTMEGKAVWTGDQQNNLKTPDPEVVLAAGRVMNQVENGSITAERLSETLIAAKIELGLTNEQVSELIAAVENEVEADPNNPKVRLIGDMDPYMEQIMNAQPLVAEAQIETVAPIAGSYISGIQFQQEITAAAFVPDPNGIEPSGDAYISFADTDFTKMNHDPNAVAYNWTPPEVVTNNAGLAKLAMSNTLGGKSAFGGSGSAAGTNTGAQPDQELMMTEEQRPTTTVGGMIG